MGTLNALPSSMTASSINPSTMCFKILQDELEAAFQIPSIARNAEDRNINTGASTSSTSSSTSIGGTPIRNLSVVYSLYHNYSQGQTSSRPREGKKQQRSSNNEVLRKERLQACKGPGEEAVS